MLKMYLYFYVFILMLGLQEYVECTTSFQSTKFQGGSIVTNPERSDGFGAQFQTIIIAVIFAELHNKTYVYSPFKKIEHNYGFETNYIEKKEWLINFIDNFKINPGFAQELDINTLISFFEENLKACIKSDSFQKIKSIFRANKDGNYFDNGYFNIAVHVRRPNTHDNRLMGTDTPDDVYLKTITALRREYSSKNLLFHIYSQGKLSDFKKYKAQDTMFHINESLEDTFIGMVFADALVTAPSSLSYVAGWLSEGNVYYIPFWHTPLPHWKSIYA